MGKNYTGIIGTNIPRIRLNVSEDGGRDHGYSHGCDLQIRTGWNEGCEFISNTLSVNELHDLRYLIDRALEAVK